MRSQQILRTTLLLVLASMLAGCSPVSSVVHDGGSAAALTGRVHGGQQPVSGSTIQLYAVGTNGDGSAATPLLTQPVTTDSQGNFTISSLYSCSGSALVYLTAVGGNPGLSTNNPSLAEMVALGPCSSLTAGTFISVSEVTTVAAVSALAPFMHSISSIGSAASDSSDLAAAFTFANQLANPATGLSPGQGLPAGLAVPTTLTNTLANVIATCVNSPGGVAGSATPCGNLFTWTTASGAAAPQTTVDALLNLALYPTPYASQLFLLISAIPPFQPSLANPPSNFQVASLIFTPTPATFATGAVGVPSASSVNVTNQADAPVTLNAFTVTGTNAADFSVTSGCPSTLSQGNSCTLQVTLTPSASGPRTALLRIDSNAAGSPQYVSLTNAPGAPVITSLAPTFIDAANAGFLTVDFPVDIYGANFSNLSVFQVNGSTARSYLYSSTHLAGYLTAAQIAHPGTLTLSIANSSMNGTASASVPFTVIPATTTPPNLTRISPAQFTAGTTGGPSLSVYGSGIVPGDTLIIDNLNSNLQSGVSFSPTDGYFVSTRLPSVVLASPGTWTVHVVHDGNLSNALSFTVVNP